MLICLCACDVCDVCVWIVHGTCLLLRVVAALSHTCTLFPATLTLVTPSKQHRRGGDLLIKLINPDAARPAVNLEQPALVEALMGLLLGDQVGMRGY